MMFTLQTLEGDVVLRDVSEQNVYIKTYGALVQGYRPPAALEVGGISRMSYRLSGQPATTYVIVRTE